MSDMTIGGFKMRRQIETDLKNRIRIRMDFIKLAQADFAGKDVAAKVITDRATEYYRYAMSDLDQDHPLEIDEDVSGQGE